MRLAQSAVSAGDSNFFAWRKILLKRRIVYGNKIKRIFPNGQGAGGGAGRDCEERHASSKDNRNISDRREAWLTLFTSDEPEEIIRLIKEYPEFRAIYEEGYEICLNMERVMEMFSKELYELDRNTVQYMNFGTML